LAFVGGEIVSFFLLLVIVDTIEALTSLVDWDLVNFVDGRGFDESKRLKELKNIFSFMTYFYFQ
jgi:hypothetical protein